jgi:hypothetical protein
MNRALTAIPLAAVLALAACSSAVPASQTLLAPPSALATKQPPPSPAAGVPGIPVYDNTQACAAFTAATTTGIPASVNVPVGTTTMQWLATQETGATPALLTQLGKFTAAWGDDPPDVAAINRAARKIGRICTGA